MTPEEKKQLKEVFKFMQQMKRFEQIPLEVSQAMTRKLGIQSVPRVATSSKSATSENQAVNEAGAGTYSVLGIPNGFVRLTDANGNTWDVPYFT